MGTRREIVITGLGVVSPIGIGRGPFWESLEAGRSGVRRVPELEEAKFPVTIGAGLVGFDGKQFVQPRKSLKLMCREIQTAFAASALAITDSGLSLPNIDHDRLGVTFGSEMFFSSPDEMVEVYHNCTVDGHFDITRWGQRMTSDLFPLWMLKHLPNMPACHIAIAHDARGPNNTFTLGEASSLHALQEASRYIQRGLADIMIVGGTGTRLNIAAVLFRGVQGLSRRDGDPAGACRPFDAERDGIVNGEGAGAVILEAADHAAARGAVPLARVLGFGNAFEGPTRPGSARTGRAIRDSITQALREAEIGPADVGFVSASGMSTLVDDIPEASAIRAELAEVPVWAPKSYFGNLGGGTAAVELVGTVCSLVARQTPGTLNYEHPDPQCPINVSRSPRAVPENRAALMLSQSLTGQAAAVLLAGAAPAHP